MGWITGVKVQTNGAGPYNLSLQYTSDIVKIKTFSTSEFMEVRAGLMGWEPAPGTPGGYTLFIYEELFNCDIVRITERPLDISSVIYFKINSKPETKNNPKYSFCGH